MEENAKVQKLNIKNGIFEDAMILISCMSSCINKRWFKFMNIIAAMSNSNANNSTHLPDRKNIFCAIMHERAWQKFMT